MTSWFTVNLVFVEMGKMDPPWQLGLLAYSSVHLTITGYCPGNFAAHKVFEPKIYFHCLLIQLDHLVDYCILLQRLLVQYIWVKSLKNVWNTKVISSFWQLAVGVFDPCGPIWVFWLGCMYFHFLWTQIPARDVCTLILDLILAYHY